MHEIILPALWASGCRTRSEKTMTPTIDHHRCLPGVAIRLHQRRGVLLLVVLSLLTLFMLLGTTYMVVTSRARATARAFARVAEASHSAQSAAGRRFVDEAFLAVVRGPANHEDANANGVLDKGEDQNSNGKLDFVGYPIGEDLLGDKYGFASRQLTAPIARRVWTGKLAAPSLISSVSGQTTQPMLVLVPVKADVAVGPEQLAGRVVTFTLPDLTWSTRILRAQGTEGQTTTGFVISLAPVTGCRGVTFSDLTAAVARAATATSTDFIVNTREFFGDPNAALPPGVAKDTNEPYDGFDDANPFLAQLVSSPAYDPMTPSNTIDSASCVRASYRAATSTNQPLVVDNDGDGVFDSVWLDFGFPVVRDSAGVACKPRVAVLVVDLDGRLNVNAHGSPSATAVLQDASSFTWPSAAPQLPSALSATQFAALPLGSGYGPPEVRLGDIFRLGSDSAAAAKAVDRLLSGNKQAIDPNNPAQPYSGAKRALASGKNVLGRYGDSASDARPGVSDVDDPLSAIQDQQRARATDPKIARGRSLRNDWRMTPQLATWHADPDDFMAPPDLSGRMKVFADRQAPGDGAVARMRYAKPVVATVHWWQGDTTDDPYEIRLDQRVAADATFAPDELERLLRLYDWDATQLPSRLAALLGPDAERLRHLLTTESWDTTAIVGTARKKIEDALAKTAATDWAEVFSPEIIGGRRLDINRPAQSAAEKDLLCRQLYTLLWALTGSSDTKSMAQWAVNVVDFRDADSTMTRFAYDKDPADGWTLGTDVVWGVERPDLLINEALAWKIAGNGGVYVSLHHPWSSKAIDGDKFAPTTANTDTPDWADPDAIDPALDAATPKNLLNLDARGGGDKDSPVWRLRVNDRIVRLDAPPSDQTNSSAFWSKPLNPGSGPDPSVNRLVPPDGSVCVFGETKRPTDGTVDVDTAFPPATAQIKIDMLGSTPANLTPGNAPVITIILERLADPAQKFAANTNEYLEIDRVEAVTVVDRTLDSVTKKPLYAHQKKVRRILANTPGTFWQRIFDQPPAGQLTDPIALEKPKAASRAACMPWLNRPYISVAELALVPPWDATTLLAQYSGFTGNGMLDKLASILNQPPQFLANLLETATVPSRFVGIATTVDEYPAEKNPFQVSTADCDPGLDKLPINQLTAYREPGRVNLNTVSDQRVWEAAVLRGPRPDGTSTVSNAALEWSTSNLGRPAGQGQPSTAKPAMSMLQMLALKVDASTPAMVADTADPGPDPVANPQFQYLTANRLANVATTRSHVFAVWVSVGFFQWDETTGKYILDANQNPLEVGADTGSSERHRGFYIFDRSIPVAYETGQDHNVRDAILLRRIIQ
jgi:hypothetical protein